MSPSRTVSRKKALKQNQTQLTIKPPTKKTREKFLIIYELKGCQKAIDYLTEFYNVKRMRLWLNGRKVGKNYIAYYLENHAYFKKIGLRKQVVLHEFYHHLINCNNIEIKLPQEEKEANCYAREFRQHRRDT
jgi:hypothetical protein